LPLTVEEVAPRMLIPGAVLLFAGRPAPLMVLPVMTRWSPSDT
jgi:hypothetical protein